MPTVELFGQIGADDEIDGVRVDQELAHRVDRVARSVAADLAIGHFDEIEVAEGRLGHRQSQRRVAHVPLEPLQIGIAGDGDFDEVVATAGRGGAKGRNVTEVGRIEGPPEESNSPIAHA